MLNWNWRQFGRFLGTGQTSRKQRNRAHQGRTPRVETLEPRMLLSVNDISLSGHANAIPTNQTTGFSSVSQTDHSAVIDLAQTHQVTTIVVGSGEASAQSPIHYASPNGSGNGTQGSPWSLAQANSQLLAGDTLYLTAGNYVGQIRPVRSGTPGNPIRIAAAPGLNPEAVHVRGATGGGNSRKGPVRVTTNYVLVEGFTVSYLNGLQVGEDVSDIRISGQHVTVRNMRVVHDATEAEGPLGPGLLGEYVRQTRKSGRPQENGLHVGGKFNLIQNNDVKNMYIGMILATDKANASFNVIRGNTILDSTWDGIHIGTGNGAPLNHLIENNVISGGLVSDGITFNGRRTSDPANHLGINQVIVRNNAIFNFTENVIDLKATQNIVVEGNYLWGSIGDNDGSGITNHSGNSLNNDETGGSGLTKGNGTESTHVIIRNNVIMDNNQAAFTERDYKVYNNTMLNNRRNFSGPNQPTAPLSANKPGDSAIKAGRTGPNASILNNLIGDHGYEISLRSVGSVAIDGNTYYNSFQTTRFAQFNNPSHDWVRHSTLAAWQSWLQTKSNFTGNEANSQVVTGGPSALFVNVPSQPTGDPAQFDFRLKANSPAIDSGVFLTKTVGSGSNKTTMSVADAKLFFDGYDITLGDEIQLAGQTARARITNISGNTLTLDSPLSWSSGTGVSLAYEGNSPDAGAIEFGTSTGNTNGDFDSDGDTDGADFLQWQRGLGSTTDADELTDWQDNYGSSAPVDEVFVDFSQVTISNYNAQGSSGNTATASNGGTTLTISGDGWKSIPFNYTVTANTVIEFDFESPIEGDIHAIGFDNDDAAETNRTLRFHGTQNTVGISTVPQYTGSGVQHFKLRIGDYGAYELGNVDRLFLVNDDDAAPFNAVGIFSNVRVYDEAAAVAAASVGSNSEAEGVERPVFLLAAEMLSPVANQKTSDAVLEEAFSESDEPASELLNVLAVAAVAREENATPPGLALEQPEEEEESEDSFDLAFDLLGIRSSV